MMRRVAAWLPLAATGLHQYHTTASLAAAKYNDPATWGLHGTSSAAQLAQAEKLAKRFVDAGVIRPEKFRVAVVDLLKEVIDPKSKAFTAAAYLRPGVRPRVDVVALLNQRLNNCSSPYNMKLIGRARHLQQLAKYIKPHQQKSQLITVIGAMGTGKTQLLKHFLGTALRQRCETGAVIVVECGLGNAASNILQSAMYKASKAPSDQVLAIMEGALNDFAKLHLEEYFPAEMKSGKHGKHPVNWWQVWKNLLPCTPLLVLDTAESLFTQQVTLLRDSTRYTCTFMECIMRALPSQSVVIAAGTLPTELADSVTKGTNFTVSGVDPLRTLTSAEFISALNESWDAKIDDVDVAYAVPLFYYLGGGVPRHLQAATECTEVSAVSMLGRGWKEAVEGMYRSSDKYLHIAVRKSGAPANDIHAEFWTAAVAAATKYPAKYDKLVVGTTDGKTYADVAAFCAASEGDTLRIPPIFINALMDKQLLRAPRDWPKGTSLAMLYTPFDRRELVLSSRRPDTPRGHVYECLIAHSLVGRWWLLQKEKGCAGVPLCDLLCDDSSHFKGYTVDLSGGIVRLGEKGRANALQWNVKPGTRHGTAIHDMMIPCSKDGADVMIPVQVRHGHAKALKELSKQLQDVSANYPGLIVVHNKAYNIPGCKGPSARLDGKWVVYVDGGAFARDDAVYAVAPFTRE